jgi:hypothetical protein
MGLFAAVTARASGEGPWSIEPVLGVSAEYTSNPLLQVTGEQAETRVAALIDVPLRYDSDQWELMLRPNARITDKTGYSSLGSDFEHLDGTAHYADELDSASLQTEVARDSSLYYLGSLADRIGVPRDTVSTSGDWTRSFSERIQINLDGSWQRVRYVEPADFNELVDYRYWSAGPTFDYSLSELDTVKVLANYGLYQSLNGATQSSSENIQLGFLRQLSEIWTLSANAGYSRSINRENGFIDYFGFLFPVTERSTQDSTVYSASLTRQGERLSVTASASQALQPTGSRQDSYSLSSTYTRSERWEFAASASWQRAQEPEVQAGEANVTGSIAYRLLNAQLTANWHWTPEWVVSVTATRVMQQYGPPTVSVASSGVNVNFIRHFLRVQF